MSKPLDKLKAAHANQIFSIRFYGVVVGGVPIARLTGAS